MGVLPIILIVLALKVPIVGLLWFMFWAAKEPEVEGPPEETAHAAVPPEPEPGDLRRGPRRRGPHGGQAQPPPSPRRDPHPAAIPRETAPVPASRAPRSLGPDRMGRQPV